MVVARRIASLVVKILAMVLVPTIVVSILCEDPVSLGMPLLALAGFE